MNNQFKKIARLGVSAAFALGVFAYSSEIANAQTVDEAEHVTEQQQNLTENEKAELRSFWSSYSVDQETQESLIAKYEETGHIDANDANNSPIEVIEGEEKIETFQDGSIRVSGVEASEDVGETDLFAVDPGSVSSGSGYRSFTGARVYHNTGTINASFYADFTLVQKGYDRITNARDEKVTVIGGTQSNRSLVVGKSNEDANGPAQATLSFDVAGVGGAVGSNAYIRLHVGGDSYYSSYDY